MSCVVCYECQCSYMDACNQCGNKLLCVQCLKKLIEKRCPLCRFPFHLINRDSRLLEYSINAFKNDNQLCGIQYKFRKNKNIVYIDRDWYEDFLTVCDILYDHVAFPICVEPIVGILYPY